MSSHNIQSFMVKLARDPGLSARVDQLHDSDIPALIKIAEEVGLPFTMQEYNTFLKVLGVPEISEDELASVAGGAMPSSAPSIKLFLKSRKLDAGDLDPKIG